eukprot:m.212336 g.212336  ORF g.212336 m.212336 type:complete len:95 (+) comp10141_c6_seq8:1788-2072(+)
MCRAANLSCRMEPKDVHGDSDKKRPDIEVTNLKKGCCSFIEVSVTNSVRASTTPLQQANRRVLEKERKYKQLAANTQTEPKTSRLPRSWRPRGP